MEQPARTLSRPPPVAKQSNREQNKKRQGDPYKKIVGTVSKSKEILASKLVAKESQMLKYHGSSYGLVMVIAGER